MLNKKFLKNAADLKILYYHTPMMDASQKMISRDWLKLPKRFINLVAGIGEKPKKLGGLQLRVQIC